MKLDFTLDHRPARLEILGLEQARRDHKEGRLSAIQFAANVYVHDQSKIKNPVVLNEPELEAFAASFVGQPFLADHAREQSKRGGTIRESELIERDGKKVIRQTIEALKPWAVEGVLDGTIDRFSIGWWAEEYLCTVCGVEYGGEGCRHDFWDVGSKDKETGEKIRVLMKGLEGMETSAVTHPASPGTGTDSIAMRLAQLSEFRKGNIAPVIPTVGSNEEGPMLEKIRQMLGLPATTPETEALTALEARLAQKPGVPKALTAALGLADTVSEDEVIAKVISLTAPGNYVPKAEHDAVLDELATFKAKEKVAAAKAAGKITPAMEAWAIEFAKRDADSFDKFLAHAPVQMPSGQAPSFDRNAPPPEKGAAGLTADELFVAKRMGRTPEEFAKDKAAVEEYEARIAAVTN